MLARLYLVFALALTGACTNTLGGGGSNGDGTGGNGAGGMTGGGGDGSGSGDGSGTGDGTGSGSGDGTGGGAGGGGGGSGGVGGGGGGGVTMPILPAGPLKLPGLVMYWGQNGFGGANPGNAAKYEGSRHHLHRAPPSTTSSCWPSSPASCARARRRPLNRMPRRSRRSAWSGSQHRPGGQRGPTLPVRGPPLVRQAAAGPPRTCRAGSDLVTGAFGGGELMVSSWT